MKISWAGYELVSGGQKIYARSCHLKKRLMRQGMSWSQVSGSAHASKNVCWAGYELVPGGQDQLVPQKKNYARSWHLKKNLRRKVGAGPRIRDQHLVHSLGKLTIDLCSLG